MPRLDAHQDQTVISIAPTRRSRRRPFRAHPQAEAVAAGERRWFDPAMVAMSIQRSDGEWRFSPWLLAGREDLYSAR